MENQYLLRILKAVNGNSTNCFCIPVGQPVFGYLKPVATSRANQNKAEVKFLTNWRNQYPSSFLTEFVANENTTSDWLSDIVDKNDSKILFMLYDLNHEAFGYMGLDHINWQNRVGEADAIVKGRETKRGAMKASILTMFSWAKEQLGLENIIVRVLSDNPALEFYRKVGFEEYKRVPLKKEILENKISWVEDQTIARAQRYLVYLTLSISK